MTGIIELKRKNVLLDDKVRIRHRHCYQENYWLCVDSLPKKIVTVSVKAISTIR